MTHLHFLFIRFFINFLSSTSSPLLPVPSGHVFHILVKRQQYKQYQGKRKHSTEHDKLVLEYFLIKKNIFLGATDIKKKKKESGLHHIYFQQNSQQEQ